MIETFEIIINKKIKDRNQLLLLCKHITYNDIMCHCGSCSFTIVNNKAIDMLEFVFKLLKQKLTITSAYRCYKHNKAVGGIKESDHLIGSAFDIVYPSNNKQLSRLLEILNYGIFEYIYFGKNYIHLDLQEFKK